MRTARDVEVLGGLAAFGPAATAVGALAAARFAQNKRARSESVAVVGRVVLHVLLLSVCVACSDVASFSCSAVCESAAETAAFVDHPAKMTQPEKIVEARPPRTNPIETLTLELKALGRLKELEMCLGPKMAEPSTEPEIEHKAPEQLVEPTAPEMPKLRQCPPATGSMWSSSTAAPL